jgi:hypothetical protein
MRESWLTYRLVFCGEDLIPEAYTLEGGVNRRRYAKAEVAEDRDGLQADVRRQAGTGPCATWNTESLLNAHPPPYRSLIPARHTRHESGNGQCSSQRILANGPISRTAISFPFGSKTTTPTMPSVLTVALMKLRTASIQSLLCCKAGSRISDSLIQPDVGSPVPNAVRGSVSSFTAHLCTLHLAQAAHVPEKVQLKHCSTGRCCHNSVLCRRHCGTYVHCIRRKPGSSRRRL